MRSMRLQCLVPLLALGCGAVSGWAQFLDAPPPPDPLLGLPTPPPPAPSVQWAEATHNFGRVMRGEVLRHEFVFTNTGRATLEITAVRPGCGCTTAGDWSRRVEPGQTGKIPIQFNSATMSGDFNRQVAVTSNDPKQPHSTLYVRGTVWTAIEVTPSYVSFIATSETTQPDTRVVRIVNHLEEAVTLSPPKSTNPAFAAELKTVRPGKEFELRLSTVPPLASAFTQGAVTLETSASQVPQLQVSATASVLPVITTTPERITLPAAVLTNALNYSVMVRNQGTNALVLSKAQTSLPGVTVGVRELQAGRYFQLSVQFPPGFTLARGQTAEVTVQSNHPKYPVLRVPVVSGLGALRPAPAAGTSLAPRPSS